MENQTITIVASDNAPEAFKHVLNRLGERPYINYLSEVTFEEPYDIVNEVNFNKPKLTVIFNFIEHIGVDGNTITFKKKLPLVDGRVCNIYKSSTKVGQVLSTYFKDTSFLGVKGDSNFFTRTITGSPLMYVDVVFNPETFNLKDEYESEIDLYNNLRAF